MSLNAPIIQQPVNGGTYATFDPWAFISWDTVTYGNPERVQVQVSTNNSFSPNTLDYMYPASYDYSGAASFGLASYVGYRLLSGTWYMRARKIQQIGMAAGTWSATTTFTVDAYPVIAPLSPKDQVSVAYDPTGFIPFIASFSSPVGATFKHNTLFLKRVSDNSIVFANGVLPPQNSAPYTTFAPDRSEFDFPFVSAFGSYDFNTHLDELLYWTMQVRDSNNQVNETAAAQFYVRTRPVVTITSDATIIRPLEIVNWTVSATDSRHQANSRVEVYEHPTSTPSTDPAFLKFSNSFVAGEAGVFDPTGLTRWVNGQWYTIVVTVQDTSGLTGSATFTAHATWSPPAAPASITLSSANHESAGYVSVTWPNTNKATGFLSWNVYRRLTGEPDSAWTLLVEDYDGTASSHTFPDYTAPTSVSLDYVVVQVADTSGQGFPAESAYTTTSTITVLTDKYWLTTYDADTPITFDFNNVNSDSFTDEEENATLLLIGRGRRKERGTRWGYAGQLSVHLIDNGSRTARAQRLAIMALKATKRPLVLRNPFGDVFAVAVDDIAFDREAGVGHREFGTLTIPYGEVAADAAAARTATANQIFLTLDDATLGRLDASNRLG